MIDPCIPKEWGRFTVTRKFRGSTYRIVVKNPRHVSKGVSSITINGKKIAGNTIPPQRSKKIVEVEVVLG
jgi:cellobiose phosphorylase